MLKPFTWKTEKSIYPWFQVRIELQDQDSTWIPAYESVRRGYDMSDITCYKYGL